MPARVRLKGQKAINKIVAPLPNVQAAVHAQAEKIGAKAKALLEGHHTPERQASVEVTRAKGKYGHLDYYVSLVDPDNAMAIEFGHIHNKSGKHVEGLYIITGAAGLR
jgi:hypothetical protein